MKTYPKHIAVVDDDPGVTHLFCKWLQASGFTTTAFSSGQEFLSELPDSRFDVLITDLDMPQMNGFQLIPRVRQIHPGMPVIISTGNSRAESAIQAIKVGAGDYITKPVRLDDLIKALERIGAQAGTITA